jgi:hypothetical protein
MPVRGPARRKKDARRMRQANHACVGPGITHQVRPVLGVVVVGRLFFFGVFVFGPWPARSQCRICLKKTVSKKPRVFVPSNKLQATYTLFFQTTVCVNSLCKNAENGCSRGVSRATERFFFRRPSALPDPTRTHAFRVYSPGV